MTKMGYRDEMLGWASQLFYMEYLSNLESYFLTPKSNERAQQPHQQVVEHRSFSFSYSPAPVLRRATNASEPSATNRSSLSRRKRLSEMFRSFSLGKRSSIDSSDSSDRRAVGKSGELDISIFVTYLHSDSQFRTQTTWQI